MASREAADSQRNCGPGARICAEGPKNTQVFIRESLPFSCRSGRRSRR